MPRALVTGGTSGIGAAFAHALADRGYDLVLVARRPAGLADTARRIGAGRDREIETIDADLAEPADVERVAARLRDAERPVDLLVNNAGHGLRTKLAAPDLAEHDAAVQLMIRAPYVLASAAIPGMRERGTGRIVNVASVAGQLPMGQYAAIKAWMTVFSESLSNELHGSGVTVTALLPGWVRTEFHDRASIRTDSIPTAMWLDADHVVDVCLDDVARGRVISIPSARYKAASGLLRLLPRSTVRWVARSISRSRAEEPA